MLKKKIVIVRSQTTSRLIKKAEAQHKHRLCYWSLNQF